MRRRSLFAGLAGLLAAPKVAAAMPAGKVFGHPVEFPLMFGGVVHDDLITFGYDSGWLDAGLLPFSVPPAEVVNVFGPARCAVVEIEGTPLPSSPGPIGIIWSGYTDDVRAADAPSSSGGARAAEGTASFSSAAHQLPVGSFHAAQLAAGAAPLASESHPEK